MTNPQKGTNMSDQSENTLTRFIIIAVPPRSIFRKLEKLIAECAILGDTYEAASFPPHVTLRTGALVPNRDIGDFIAGFKTTCENIRQAKISTVGIHFKSYEKDGAKRFFIGYHIEKTEQLYDLHLGLISYDVFIKDVQKEFNPHLSLAYHDLEEDSFLKLKNHIISNHDTYGSDYSWTIDAIGLYAKNDGKWKPNHVLRLK
jgi:2'-5' RNA ligase